MLVLLMENIISLNQKAFSDIFFFVINKNLSYIELVVSESYSQIF